jgi:hypothetical protein
MTRTIPQIDKDIDANRCMVVARERLTSAQHKRLSAHDWQAIRDRNPDFDRRDHELWRERGFAQLERDQREHDRIMGAARKARAPRPKKCPTCGNHTLFAA